MNLERRENACASAAALFLQCGINLRVRSPRPPSLLRVSTPRKGLLPAPRRAANSSPRARAYARAPELTRFRSQAYSVLPATLASSLGPPKRCASGSENSETSSAGEEDV